MGHHIRIDGIGLAVAAHRRVDGAADVATLTKDVVGLKRHGGCLSFQEAVRHLGVPYQLVGVHLCAGITSAAVHAQVRGEAEAVVHVQVVAAAIGEVVGAAVVGRDELTLLVVVVHVAVQRHVP